MILYYYVLCCHRHGYSVYISAFIWQDVVPLLAKNTEQRLTKLFLCTGHGTKLVKAPTV